MENWRWHFQCVCVCAVQWGKEIWMIVNLTSDWKEECVPVWFLTLHNFYKCLFGQLWRINVRMDVFWRSNNGTWNNFVWTRWTELNWVNITCIVFVKNEKLSTVEPWNNLTKGYKDIRKLFWSLILFIFSSLSRQNTNFFMYSIVQCTYVLPSFHCTQYMIWACVTATCSIKLYKSWFISL